MPGIADKLTPKNIAIGLVAAGGLFVLYRALSGKCGSCCSGGGGGGGEKKQAEEDQSPSSPPSIQLTQTPTTGSSSSSSPATAASSGGNTSGRIDGFVMSGPSGVGKGTILKRLLETRKDNFSFCVSHTTREPRDKEVDGKDYHFSTKEKVLEMDARGEFLELCPVHSNFYGTSIKALEAVTHSGKCAVIEVDVKGSQKIKNALAKSNSKLNIVYLFLNAPDLKEIENRIKHRGGESEEKIKVRLETAKQELAFLSQQREHFDKVFLNDNLDKCYAEIESYLTEKGAIPK